MVCTEQRNFTYFSKMRRLCRRSASQKWPWQPLAALTVLFSYQTWRHIASVQKAYLQVSLVVTCIISIHLISQDAKASTPPAFFCRERCKRGCRDLSISFWHCHHTRSTQWHRPKPGICLGSKPYIRLQSSHNNPGILPSVLLWPLIVKYLQSFTKKVVFKKFMPDF